MDDSFTLRQVPPTISVAHVRKCPPNRHFILEQETGRRKIASKEEKGEARSPLYLGQNFHNVVMVRPAVQI